MATDDDELRNRLESALGALTAGSVDPSDVVAVSWPIASHFQIDGQVTIFHALRPTRCVAGKILDVGGVGITGDDGLAELSLNYFLCIKPPQPRGATLQYDSPANVVATPRSNRPIYLTTTIRYGPGQGYLPDDLYVTVYAWNVDGTPLGGTRFYWRCTVPVSYAEN